MKICGIIAEYNPFHNGHQYHIEKTLKKINADFVVIVMSGNFTQRGEPAIFDKWTRAKTALMQGADVVIELPILSAVRSAESFASGSIDILNAINADYISFGSEINDMNILNDCANLFLIQPEKYKKVLKNNLKLGMSFPAARLEATIDYFTDENLYCKDQLIDVLKASNSILAIEYLKALKKSKSKIQPVAIKRLGSDYTDEIFKGEFSSAMAIRKEIFKTGKLNTAESSIPILAMPVLNDVINQKFNPVSIKHFEEQILYTLRLGGSSFIKGLPEVTEGLENRIYEAVKNNNNIENLLTKIKTKRFTRTRLNRILIYALLGITKKTLKAYDNKGPEYIRVLGTSKKGEDLLSQFSKKGKLPLLINPSGREDDFLSLKYDICASDIYALSQTDEKFFKSGRDFTEKLIKL